MTKNFAHRGFSSRYPENTMLAFRKAVEEGCDGIELDAQLTRDGEVVIIHDENLKRTTGRSGFVRDFTLQELRQFDASCGMSGELGINPIPTLREYFEFACKQAITTNIELKNSVIPYEGLEEKVLSLMQEYRLRDRIILSSFNHQSIVKCKKLLPQIRCGFLSGCWQLQAGAYSEQYGMDVYNPVYHFLTEENLSELRQHHIDICTWTVNEEADMKRLVDAGVYAIITNCPDVLKRILPDRATERRG